MTEKLVSVIMPACNAERYIGQALESARSQTYQNWEILVTSDGGADATGRMVSEFARQTDLAMWCSSNMLRAWARRRQEIPP
jgi:teichuronic acid biosynthesis glycosyltransferase TuaG